MSLTVASQKSRYPDLLLELRLENWAPKSRGSLQIESRGPDLGAIARVALCWRFGPASPQPTSKFVLRVPNPGW